MFDLTAPVQYVKGVGPERGWFGFTSPGGSCPAAAARTSISNWLNCSFGTGTLVFSLTNSPAPKKNIRLRRIGPPIDMPDCLREKGAFSRWSRFVK